MLKENIYSTEITINYPLIIGAQILNKTHLRPKPAKP
jgi:hypothetical protein